MNSPYSGISQASRPAAIYPASGWLLASSVLLLTAGALAAAPTPKPSLTPAATPVATPAMTPAATPAASASASPAVEAKATYSGTQQKEYISTAVEAFVALRQAQSQPFVDAHNALEAAGGVNSKGLGSKEAITTRRDLIAKCIAANEQYLNFAKTQVDTYRAELAKTPLVPGDVATIADDFSTHSNTAGIVKLHENEREALKAGDEMIASLEKSYGGWSVDAAGRLTFKKKSAVGSYSEMAQKYNTLAKAGEAMRQQMNTANAVPSASAPPAAVPGATASPTATASPAASAKPTVAASPAH